ncbi:MAG TPA: 2Fe-2S iron-sulfur cluster-binding protein, partial [Paraburkholderia sp.]
MRTVTPTSLKVNVWRGADEGEFQRFDVPRMESQTVLDVVIHIQRHLDATLSYRFACRVGMCGSCAMTVNGRARWTCRTHVTKVLKQAGDVLEIAPLNHLPVIKDLAADITGFFDKWRDAKGYFAGVR